MKLASPSRALAGAALLAAAAAAGIVVTHGALLDARAAWPKEESHAIVPPPRVGRIVSLGYNELAADLYWAKTTVYYGEGMSEGSSLSDVDSLVELVNALDPWFRRPYVWGAFATTFRQSEVTSDEYRASVKVLERAIRIFPEDWELNWLLGLRYFLDMKSDDPAEQRQLQETGAAYIEKAMRCPNAPQDLGLLASSMRSKLGQQEKALAELREMIVTTDDAEARAKLVARYQQLTSKDMGDEVERAREEFVKRWEADLPYVPPAMYLLVGPRPEAFAPETLPRIMEFDVGDSPDAGEPGDN